MRQMPLEVDLSKHSAEEYMQQIAETKRIDQKFPRKNKSMEFSIVAQAMTAPKSAAYDQAMNAGIKALRESYAKPAVVEEAPANAKIIGGTVRTYSAEDFKRA